MKSRKDGKSIYVVNIPHSILIITTLVLNYYKDLRLLI